MRILFLTMANITSINQQGIYEDLIREFISNGHSVDIICPTEKRNSVDIPQVEEHGARLLLIKTGNIQKTRLFKKGIATLRLESQFIKGIKKHYFDTQYDLVMYSTPPITFANIVRYIKTRDNATSYLLLKDIFPQNAVDLKIISKANPIYWWFRHKEIQLYKLSDFIGCMSKANVDYIIRHNPYISTSVVEVCPNSINPKRIQLGTLEKTEIKAKYCIPNDSTLFLYGGNIGKPQGIDFLIDCIRASSQNNKIFYAIVGAGTEYQKLKNYFNAENPKNAVLLTNQDKVTYQKLVHASDVGLIFLSSQFTIPNFPSRMLGYMEASLPVLAATDSNTDIGTVIETGKFGFWCESGDLPGFLNRTTQLCDNELRQEMGGNARKYLEANYTSKHSYQIIADHFTKNN